MSILFYDLYMKKLLVILLSLLLVSCSDVNKIEDIKAVKFPLEIHRGFNLGNSLDCASKDKGYTLDTEEFWYNPKTNKHLIDYVKEIGFDCIRIPVTYLNHIDDNLIIDARWLDRVEESVKYSLENNLYTIINIHHDTGMNPSLNWIFADSDNYEENKEKYIKLWSQIADRFKDYDERLIFQGSGEWMNPERNWNRSDSYEDFKIVHELNQEFINVIRKSGSNNASRYLMISAFSASGESDILEAMFYKDFIDSIDNRLILSIHSYDLDIDRIYDASKDIVDISNKYSIPVIIDEFGISAIKNRNKSLKAFKAFNELSNAYDIPLIIWDDGYEYKLIDRNNYSISDKEVYEILFTR